MANHIDRRKVLGTGLAAGVFTIVPRHVLGGRGHIPPSEKITVAHIGMGTQGFRELGDLLGDPHIQVVAVCDPNKDSHDYVEWGKNSIRNRIRGYLGDPTWRANRPGCPGGREVGREVIEAYYANQRGGKKFRGCATYADFRELLENGKEIDAVKVMTPDHLHGCISIAAMKQGKHVLMHKPIANRLHEGRRVLETARETKVATHLLAYGSGTGNGRIAEQINQGVIGTLREVHNWTNRPVWPQYPALPSDRPPVPAGLDWDLWLGPERDRPFHPSYTHTVYRGWFDFGGGSMADMGIYSLWPVFAELGLEAPLSAEAEATHTCTIVDNVSRRAKNDHAYPAACTLRFRFAPQADRSALDLFWYDGGMKPRLPREIEALHGTVGREGILFIGDEGSIMAGFHGQEPVVFARGQKEALIMPGESPRWTSPPKRYLPWKESIQTGNQSPGSFLHTGAITDTVNLGTVALRTGRKVHFDSAAMKITNIPAANQYLRREYRKGWEL